VAWQEQAQAIFSITALLNQAGILAVLSSNRLPSVISAIQASLGSALSVELSKM
jgi:hypothetical protein